MQTLIHLSLIIFTFFLMEGVAWFTHKYIMHGFLWSWHRSHHRVHPHALERNDLFALVFSLPSALLIFLGFESLNYPWLKFIGFGILAYGVFYFIFHDIIVHQRIKLKIRKGPRYLRRIIKAHYIHHECHQKHGAKAFGFLYAPKKYSEPNK